MCFVCNQDLLLLHWYYANILEKLSYIISAVDEEVKTLNCKKNSKRGCNNRSTKCITHNLWDQLDQHINGFFEGVKLQDLTRNN